MTQPADERFMALALSLGRRGQGRVWPNPAVGCVIVKDGVIVGRGRTADGGRPHAETQALRQAGTAAKGATAYVTLEPCSHQGQTPPCAKALIQSGISRCVVAVHDPDARVSGRGVALLRDAGITVETGLLADQAREDLAGYLQRTQLGRPFVTLKLATTLDGRIATRTGDSQWITGPSARRVVHSMRARHDAVMVGAGTVRADDPTLNVRDMGEVRQPIRVIVSSKPDLPRIGNLARTLPHQPVWICHSAGATTGAWSGLGALEIACDTDKGGKGVAVDSVLSALSERGITRVFCEGGGALAASLLRAGVVNELIIFQGGRVIGGDGLSAIAGFDVITLSDGPNFTRVSQQAIGPDIMHRWRKTQA